MLMVSPGTGNIAALVSFFQGMTFGVRLGCVPSLAERSTVIFIDPHAENPPQDIRMQQADNCPLEVEKPEPLQGHLERMVSENVVADGISNLLNRINRWKFETEVAPVVHRLNAVRTKPIARRQELEAALSELRGYVFLLLNYLAVNMPKQLSHIPGSDFFVEILKEIATLDRSQDSGVSPITEGSIFNAVDALIDEIEAALLAGEIDIDYLWKLLRTTYGVGLIGPKVLSPIFAELFRQAEASNR